MDIFADMISKMIDEVIAIDKEGEKKKCSCKDCECKKTSKLEETMYSCSTLDLVGKNKGIENLNGCVLIVEGMSHPVFVFDGHFNSLSGISLPYVTPSSIQKIYKQMNDDDFDADDYQDVFGAEYSLIWERVQAKTMEEMEKVAKDAMYSEIIISDFVKSMMEEMEI